MGEISDNTKIKPETAVAELLTAGHSWDAIVIEVGLNAKIASVVLCFAAFLALPVKGETFDEIFNTGSNRPTHAPAVSGAFARATAPVTNSRIKQLTKQIESDPSNSALYLDRGQEYIDTNRPELALLDVDKALDLGPKSAKLWALRSICNARLGDRSEAVQDLTNAIALDPKDADLFARRGSGYRFLKQFALAIDSANKSVELAPSDPDNLYSRALIYYELKDFDLAISDCTAAINLNPKLGNAFVLRGLARIKKGNVQEGNDDLARGKMLGID